MRDERPQECCPACGSGRIACVLLVSERLDFCMQCQRVWEPLPPGEPYTIDGEQMPFKIPCDNCAFRGGSTERADPEAWGDLQHMLAVGGRFYCHKGVPFKATDNPHSFEFPRQTARADIAGQCHPYQTYDTQRMRLCRGYLNAHIAPLLKKAFAHETT